MDLRRLIFEAIEASATPRSELWLCYDPMERDPLDIARFEDDRSRRLGVPQHIALEPKQRPCVLPLGGTDDWKDCRHRLLEASITAAHEELHPHTASVDCGRSICGWLWVPTERAYLSAHLNDAMKAIRPGVGWRWVRWHDPRVRMQLWPLLKSAQRSALLGPISSWVGINALGKVFTVNSNSVDVSAEALHLTPEQWQRLDDCALTHELLQAWSTFAEQLPGTALDVLHRYLKTARDAGLTHPDDLSTYCLFALQLRADFAADEAAAKTLRSALATPGSLMQSWRALGEAYWASLSQQPTQRAA